jgi:hypothetical protein
MRMTMNKERELLRRISSHSESRIPTHFIKEIQQLLDQPEQEPINFDLERMKLAVESPVSDVTVEGLIDKVKSNREHIVDVTDKVEPVAWRCNLLGNVITDKPADNNSYTPLYKSPPKREPLSDEEIAELWWNTYVVGTADSVRNFARAIEKAHGIGGGDE